MIIAEDLLMLHLEDKSGMVADQTWDITLAGALLVELAMAERVRVSGPGEAVRKGRMIVTDNRSLGDPLLDEALAFFAGAQGGKPADLLPKLAKDLRRSLLYRLSAQGLVEPEKKKFLFFTWTRWNLADRRRVTSIVQDMRDVLVTGRSPDMRTASIVALLSAIDRAGPIVGADRKERWAIAKQAKQIAKRDWASSPVHKAIQDAQAASSAAVIAAVSAATVATSSAATASCSTGGGC